MGITVTMVNPLANLTEITYQLENTKARALFVFPMFAQNAYNAKKDVPRIRDIFLYGETTRKTHEHRAGAELDKFDLYVKSDLLREEEEEEEDDDDDDDDITTPAS